MAKSKKRCVTGIPKKAEREAIGEFDGVEGTLAAATIGYVATIPKYPESGTPEYYACIQKWYAAYQQAQRMDDLVRQISGLQGYVSQLTDQIGLLTGQLNAAQPILDALVGAYTDCMEGTPV